MSLATLRQQRNELADKMKALVPINAETGQIDMNGKELSDEDLAKYQALGRQVQAMDTLITGEESAEAVEASRNVVAEALAAKNGVSTDEARATVQEKRRAWSNVLWDQLGTELKLNLPARATEEQRELLNINTGDDAKGGYAVPSEVIDELMVELNNENVVRPLATVGTRASGVTARVPIFDLVAYEGGTGKPAAKAESDSVAGNPVSPDPFAAAEIEFQVSQVPAVAISEEFLQDSTIDGFANEMLSGMAEMLGSWENGLMSAHAAPSGATKIRGFLVDAGDAGSVAGAADSFDVNDLAKLYGALKSRYRRRATFMLGRQVITKAITFTVGQVPAWTPGFPNGRGGVGSPTLLGIPYVENDSMPSHEDPAGSRFIALGDFRRYRVYDVAGSLSLRTYTDSRFAQNHAIGVQVFNRTGARLVTAQSGLASPLIYMKSK